MSEEEAIEKLRKVITEYLVSNKENFDEVINIATRFSTENSITDDSLLEQARLYISRKSYSLAYIFAKTCIILSIEDTKKITAYNIAGIASYFMSRISEAEEQYKMALQVNPNDANTRYNYGTLLYELGRISEAEEQYKMALQVNPNDSNTHSNYGLLLSYMGRNSEAEEQYKMALQVNPNDSNTHSNYGVLLSKMGRISEAEEQYKMAIQADPKHANTHYNYGTLLYEMGRISEAEEQYKMVLELNQKHVNIHSNYGVLLSKMGREEEAEEQYKMAIQADPKHVNTHSNYGTLLSNMGRYSEAEEQYKMAIQADPNDANTHYNYGLLLSKMGRKEVAEEQYKMALQVNPNDSNTHSNYGTLLSNMGRKGEAEEQYKMALQVNLNDANTRSNYGVLLSKMGREEEAEKQYKMAIQADPNDTSMHSNYGNLLKKIGRKEEAEEQYKLALKLDPKNANAHIGYSFLLLSLGLEKEEDAIEEMKTASRLFGEKGDKIKEYLVLAWLYEELANIYYNFKKYVESGQYAELSGIEYLRASEQKGTKSKETFLTKGYMLKGRAYIRKLKLQSPYDEKIYEKIMDGIYAASLCYQKAAEVSPKDNQMCNACSLSMKCLSEILNYMLAVTKQEKVPKLKSKVEEWGKNIESCKNAYNESDKGTIFIKSLEKMIICVEKYQDDKENNTWEEKRDLKICIEDLIEIAKNMEGPLQKVIEEATKQMDYCKSKTLYMGTKTKPYISEETSLYLESEPLIESKDDSSKPNLFLKILTFVRKEPIITGIIGTVVGGIIVIYIQKRYFP